MIDCNITKNYFSEKARMTKITNTGVCKIMCANCPLSEKNNGKGRLCVDYELHYPEQAIKVVQRWSDKHQQKTYLSEYLKHYPNALLNDDGIPKAVCPYDLGLMNKEVCRKTCIECWNQPVEEGEER